MCGSAGQAGAHENPEEEQSDGHIQQHVDWTSLHDEEVRMLLTSTAEVFMPQGHAMGVRLDVGVSRIPACTRFTAHATPGIQKTQDTCHQLVVSHIPVPDK